MPSPYIIPVLSIVFALFLPANIEHYLGPNTPKGKITRITYDIRKGLGHLKGRASENIATLVE